MTGSAVAAEDVVPPFGFQWNQESIAVEKVLGKVNGARITSRERKLTREVWTVEGLVQPGLSQSLFTFRNGKLAGIELHYTYPQWSVEKYADRMGQIRRYFDDRFGTGKLVSRVRDTDTEVVQTLVGYQWIAGSTMLELFYFSAVRDRNAFRTITIDYKLL